MKGAWRTTKPGLLKTGCRTMKTGLTKAGRVTRKPGLANPGLMMTRPGLEMTTVPGRGRKLLKCRRWCQDPPQPFDQAFEWPFDQPFEWPHQLGCPRIHRPESALADWAALLAITNTNASASAMAAITRTAVEYE